MPAGWSGAALVGVVLSAFATAAAAGEPEAAGAAATDDSLAAWLEWIATGIEVAGTAVIVLGGLLATVLFVGRLVKRQPFGGAYHTYRANLGQAILLGLEFLVAADIIGTIAVDPTFESLGVLAIIVVLRTFLSFTLELEIEGRWPWQGDPMTRSKDRGAPEG